MKKLIPQKLKNLYHLACAVLACVVFGFPARRIKVIGVTGTNGKTTTVQMIAKILEEAGKTFAMASTINFKIGEKEWTNKTKFTTLSAWQTQKFIKEAVGAGCEYLVLEVSSHSLDQNRVWGIDFDVAVVTNVTREHLDYHETMKKYREAKMKLFGKLKEEGIAVVNLEMERPEEFLAVAGKKIGYTVGMTNYKLQMTNKFQISNFKKIVAENVELVFDGSSFKIENTDFKLNLIGKFNIENALAAVCTAVSQGVDLKTCSSALEKLMVVPGRMDEVENDRGIKIIIDYALTPDSMKKLGELLSSRQIARRQNDKLPPPPNPLLGQEGESKLIWVFGSCGERDRGKRPIMGEIVSRYADFAIVTNEDPYGEDPMQIINEVFNGVVGKKDGKVIMNHESRITKHEKYKKQEREMVEGLNAWRIFDRREAIKKALELAQKGDMVLITGKGAEETMAIGDERIEWNDREVVESLLG